MSLTLKEKTLEALYNCLDNLSRTAYCSNNNLSAEIAATRTAILELGGIRKEETFKALCKCLDRLSGNAYYSKYDFSAEIAATRTAILELGGISHTDGMANSMQLQIIEKTDADIKKRLDEVQRIEEKITLLKREVKPLTYKSYYRQMIAKKKR